MPGDDAGSGGEVLAALVASLRAELAGSQAALARAVEELAAASERIAELEARLRQTPRNSSRPPSSEGPGKPPPRRSLRKRSGRKPGGQDGHEGSTLAQVAWPDRELRHEPACCGRCGAGLAGRPVTGVERRQVFDLPGQRRAARRRLDLRTARFGSGDTRALLRMPGRRTRPTAGRCSSCTAS